MASFKRAFNTAASFTCTLASLASSTSGVGRQSTIIDNSTGLYIDALVMIKVKTGASGVSATGYIDVYAIGTVDGGTTYTDGAGASDAGLTVVAARKLGSFPAVANATTYTSQVMSVAQAFGGVLPAKWGIVVVNVSGAALDATEGNHAKLYQEVYATVA